MSEHLEITQKFNAGKSAVVLCGEVEDHAVQGLGSRAVSLTPQVSPKLCWNIEVPTVT